METKKTRRANVNRKRGLYFGVGMIISISLTITAFEWRFYDDDKLMDLGNLNDNFEELIVIPPTIHPPPKPQVVHPPKIEIVDDKAEVPEVVDTFNSESIETDEIPVPEFIPAPEVAPEPDFFLVVEENASFTGGPKAYVKFLKKNLKYPNQARRMGIEGKVYVQFIINRDGSIVEVQAIKGIGAGCDEEAVRVISKSPKWNPGKQRGVPVRQKIVVPIVFKLG